MLRRLAPWSTSSRRRSRPPPTRRRSTTARTCSPTPSSRRRPTRSPRPSARWASAAATGSASGSASGTTDLYVAILGVLVAGAAYVPVDADDPDERAAPGLRRGRAWPPWSATASSSRARARPASGRRPSPTPDDDAWVIFTSGSTGTPKGVAVTHRIGRRLRRRRGAAVPAGRAARARRPGDGRPVRRLRRLVRGDVAGLGHGACLVPAPRSLVRSGMDLGPWLVANGITVVSTVPTLVALWPAEALDAVRLLILGGEACPPELGARLAAAGREVWNTYGPTEATVVACAARLTGERPGADRAAARRLGPRRRRRARRSPVAVGEAGRADHRRRRAGPLPRPGQGRREVRADARARAGSAPTAAATWCAYDAEGLVFVGRADDQVKLGGRRIELGEIDSALLALPGSPARPRPCAPPRRGNQLLVGYVADRRDVRPAARWHSCARTLPAALVPRLARVEDAARPGPPARSTGTRCPGRCPASRPRHGPSQLHGTAAWLARAVARPPRGRRPTAADDDFFDLGGGSLTAAQLVLAPAGAVPRGHRRRHLRAPDARRPRRRRSTPWPRRPSRRTARCRPSRVKTQVGQVVVHAPAAHARRAALAGLGRRSAATCARGLLGLAWLPHAAPGGWSALGWLLLVTPPGRMLARRGRRPAAAARARARATTRAAARCTCGSGSPSAWPTSSAPPTWPGRRGCTLLRAGARRAGRPATSTCTRLPPVTGLLTLGAGCSIEPEVDLARPLARRRRAARRAVTVGANARVGARSMLLPGRRTSARAPRSPRARRSSARSRPASAGPGRPAERVGARPRARGRPAPPQPAALGCSAYARHGRR